MKKNILFILISFLLSTSLFCENARIISLEGDVEYRINQNSPWEKAMPDIEIPEGGAIKTGETGKAAVEIGKKSKIWLDRNTALEVEQKQNLINRLALVFGRIKVRVAHLKRKEKFELRTPTAVCAVRGTEFVVETDAEGKMELRTLFGEVKLTHLVTPQKGEKEVTITQGQYFKIEEKDKIGIKRLMTKEQEIEGLQKWDPGLSREQRIADIKQKEMDRIQIRDFANNTRKTEDMVKGFIYKGRESDLEAGRTLRDIHGNLVRVDQRLVRPEPSTLQFFNIVKRPVYNYGPDGYTNQIAQQYGFKYNGGALENRLDLLLFTMHFDHNLPQSITEWPGFFDKNSVKPQWASFMAANKTYNDEIFFIGEGYKYDPARDELINNTNVVGVPVNNANDHDVLLTGIIKDDDNTKAFDGLTEISKLKIQDNGTNDGKLKYSDTGNTITGAYWALKDNPYITGRSGNYTYEKTGDTMLYQYKADAYYIGGNVLNPKIWLAQENYVISNSGGIKRTGDFTNSSSDPFSLLKESAAESIMYIKANDGTTGNVDKVNDYFKTTRGHYESGTNIDLVIVPDLAIAGVQKVLPALDKLRK